MIVKQVKRRSAMVLVLVGMMGTMVSRASVEPVSMSDAEIARRYQERCQSVVASSIAAVVPGDHSGERT